MNQLIFFIKNQHLQIYQKNQVDKMDNEQCTMPHF